MNYSLGKGVLKSVVRLLLAVGPSLISLLPSDLANLTLGGLLLLGLNYLKVKTEVLGRLGKLI